MPSPESTPQNHAAGAVCAKGCSEICADCTDFDLRPDWDAAAAETPAAEPAVIVPPAPHTQGRSWLDSRLAEIAARLETAVKSCDPAPALDRFSERLDNFEARVEAVVDRAVAGEDRESLRFIEARVREIDDQFGKMTSQIGRLSTIDARVAEIWDHVQLDLPSPTAGLPKLVEGAVTRAMAAASVLKSEAATSEGPDAAAVERIETALNRLIERVEAIETQPAEDAPGEDPGIDIELLNRAYEEGARALGLISTDEPQDRVHTLRALHAADYAPRAEAGASTAALDPDEADLAAEVATYEELYQERAADPHEPAAAERVDAPQEAAPAAEAMLEMLKASALRAKQRAQAEAQSAQGRDVELPLSAFVPSEAPAEGAAAARSISIDAVRPALRAQSPAIMGTAKRPLSQGRWNRGFFLALIMLGLSGASYVTVDRLMSSPADLGARSLVAPRAETGAVAQQVANHTHKAPADLATPTALPPEDKTGTELSGAQVRAAALPATIASASLRHAAANGDSAAEFEIGARYADGRGVAPDMGQAFAWYQRSAMHGYTPAQFRLAAFYERGVGVEKDVERAKVWYRRAAEKGHAKAMHNVAVLLASGGGQDMVQAARWFREAAERNLADSQYNLALMHENGEGMPKNLTEAFKWYALAARSGDTEAARRLEAVRGQLSRSEIAAAERAVAQWQPTPAAIPGETIVPERAAP